MDDVQDQDLRLVKGFRYLHLDYGLDTGGSLGDM